ncbi:MAG: glycosyltransferase family 2 protein [Elusimicrobiales bacterium]
MKKLISIVTSAYNEEGCIDFFAHSIKKAFEEIKDFDFEVIFVENGSTDRTYEKMIEINKNDNRFKIVRLSRNFRMDGGITAGLQYAKGDAVIMMTANLQDKPSLIPQLVKKWEEGYEHVYAVVKSRPGKSIFRKINSKLFYIIINYLTDDLIPKNASDYRLIDKKIVKVINGINERNRFMRGLFAWVGFKSIGIEFERDKRYAGKSHAHFWKVLELALKGIFAFSYKPIYFISGLGFIIALLSFIYLLFNVLKILLFGVPFAGYGTIISLVLFLFGFNFFILGILSLYIAQVYEEVKQRPNYIVKELVGIND